MFNNPYGGWPPYPQQPVVFIPPNNQPSSNPLEQIRLWKQSIEELEKAFKKEEKKDDKDKDKDKKKQEISVPALALFLLLMSPITGKIMLGFFQWGMTTLPHP